MKTLRTNILLMLILSCLGIFGQIVNFAKEEKSKNVISELKEVEVEGIPKVLSQKERDELVRSVTKLYIKAVRQKQSNYISLQTPLYTLLKTNFPNIKEREEERGVSLSNIIKFLNSNPENRRIINSTLIEQEQRKCS
jgi:thymidylate synthase